jgi:cation/acetate symporter
MLFKLNAWIAVYVAALIALLFCLVVAERYGAKRALIGWTLIGTTVILYAVLGFVCRTAVPLQYYVAGRSIPAFTTVWQQQLIGFQPPPL